MNSPVDRETVVKQTVHKLRVLTIAALVTLPVIAMVGYRLPRVRLPHITPIAVTVISALVALVLSLTVERVAQRLLRRSKRAYAEHGSRELLLADYSAAYVKVLAMIEMIPACGLVVAIAGTGPNTSLWFVGIAAVLVLLAWPTPHKVRTLLRRADDLDRRRQDQFAG